MDLGEQIKDIIVREIEGLRRDLKKDLQTMDSKISDLNANFKTLDTKHSKHEIMLEGILARTDAHESRLKAILNGLDIFHMSRSANTFDPFVGASYSQTSVSHPPLVHKSRSRLLRER
jgi:hypothetical protein